MRFTHDKVLVNQQLLPARVEQEEPAIGTPAAIAAPHGQAIASPLASDGVARHSLHTRQIAPNAVGIDQKVARTEILARKFVHHHLVADCEHRPKIIAGHGKEGDDKGVEYKEQDDGHTKGQYPFQVVGDGLMCC